MTFSYPSELEAWGYSEVWHRRFTRAAPPGCFPARVVRDHRGYFRVHTAKGELIATTAGRLKHEAQHASDLPAVGDFVALKEVREDGHQHGRGVIQLVLPRTTAFKRKAAGHLTEEQIVAANIDTVFIVCGLDSDYSPRRVERYLILARESGARAVVLLNKSDKCADPAKPLSEVAVMAGDTPIHLIAAKPRIGLETLPAYLGKGDTIAFLGSSGAGKSTLINALLGEERLIAFDTPGTTRDAITVDFRFENRDYQLIDTAGIRRRGKVHETIEKFSVVKTLQAIEDCNVCVLLIDAVEGVSDQDAAIASYILEAGCALVIALNKWDAVPADERDRVEQEFSRKLYFLSWARMHPISALKRRSLHLLMRSVNAAYAASVSKLSTPKLTRMLQAAVLHQAPPRHGPVRPKMRYAHQGGQNPPIIVIHGSALANVSETYKRFLEGWFRERFGLQGTPLRIELRSGSNPYAPKTPR